jgi:hypothetical protein
MTAAVSKLVGGKGPRQLIWESIREVSKHVQEFTESEIHLAINHDVRGLTSPGAIADYRKALVAAGILAVASKPVLATHIPGTYRLVKDEGLEAPRIRKDGTRVTQGLAQEQMWRTLRLLQGDTNARELAAHASTQTIHVPEDAAKSYLGMLIKAEYLVLTKAGKGTGKGGIQARYRLKPSRNTGPRPPMICRTKVVYDPNEDKIVWAPVVTDEDAIYER